MSCSQVGRQKIDKLSGEVVDSNPYSRLMALQRMGIVKDYESIRSRTVRGRWPWWWWWSKASARWSLAEVV